ncbi:MAG: hypothetical protein RR531_06665 [Longicatena sp.]
MWNNLKSDLYRTFHMKAFYVTLILAVVAFMMILGEFGLQNNTPFATFHRGKDTFVQFLYYTPKSMMYSLLVLVFVGIFSTDEYNCGYVKNTYPLQSHKSTLAIARYFYCVIICTIFLIAILVGTCLLQIIIPISMGSFNLLDYLPFAIVQVLTMAAASSFSMLLSNITKSKVLVILYSIGYGMIIYMTVCMLLGFMFHDISASEWMMYVLSSKLPYTFQMEAYRDAILVLIGNTLLYNGISYLILKKQDI